MSKTDAELREEMNRECRNGQDYQVHVVFANPLAQRLAIGTDTTPDIVKNAIVEWGQSVNAAEHKTPPVVPLCIICDAVIRKGKMPGEGNVAGWAVMIPIRDDDKGIVATGALCTTCGSLTQAELTQKLAESIRSECNAEVRVHKIQ